jgi:rRNA maturation protein Rpf1
MANINELKEQEMKELVTVETEEVNLEDLLVLGEEKKIPIHITFPHSDGETKSNAKALIKQLTLKELDNLKIKGDMVNSNMSILQIALFKQNGDTFTRKELEVLPIGVVNAIATKILEVSGVDIEEQRRLSNF